MVQVTKITEEYIKDNSISGTKFKDSSVNETKFAENSIGTSNLQNLVGTSTKFQVNSVTNEKIFDGSIDTTQVQDNSIPPEKLADTGFPIRGIVCFWGNIVDIPDGWSLCNGSAGTPDMRDYFVVGEGNENVLGTTGGSNTQTTSLSGSHGHSGTSSSAGSHNHGGSAGNVALSDVHIPPHRHMALVVGNVGNTNLISPNQAVSSQKFNGAYAEEYILVTAGTVEPNIGLSGPPTDIVGNPMGSGSVHNHIINTDGSHNHGLLVNTSTNHSHEVDVRPKYYALAFIMRVS